MTPRQKHGGALPPRLSRKTPVRDAYRSEMPQVQKDLERPTAHHIFAQVSENGRQELERPARALAVSGLAGGIVMGLTALSVSIATAELGHSGWAQFVAYLLYPIGFIAVILGRAQLFTENTLYPVALVLAERRHFGTTLRLWTIVLASNCAGAFVFALLVIPTGALKREYVASMANIGLEAANQPLRHIFWSAVIGGWIIAMVAWLVSGSHSVSGSVMLIWLLCFIVGLGHFAHSVATSGEILATVLDHKLPALGYFRWLWPAVAGNVCGGVLLVTLLECGQVKEE
ncbi:MAG: formate/nitrite transporter family protein [Acidobacteriaceae bacterium]